MAPTDQVVLSKVPGNLVCPITQELLKDPVDIDPCGHTFSKDAIERWLKQKIQIPTCPCCRAEIDKTKEGKPNDEKELEIALFLKPFSEELLKTHNGNVAQAILFSIKQGDDESDYYKHMPKQLGVNSENEKGETALWLAFKEGDQKAFDVLISCGASLKPISDHLIGEHGNNPAQAILTLIRQGGQLPHFYKDIPDYLGVDTKNNEGETALLIALREGDVQSFDQLISMGASLKTIQDEHALLVLAIKSDNMGVIKRVLAYLIIKEFNTQSEEIDKRIYELLNGIRESGNTVEYFRSSKKGIEPLLDERNQNMRITLNFLPVLLYEQESSNYKIMSVAGFYIDLSFIDQQDKNGHTPLSSALSQNDEYATIMLTFGAKTVFQRDDGTYYDILDDHRIENPLAKSLTESQFYGWINFRLKNYMDEKDKVIARFRESRNIFYKIWGFILSVLFNRKFEAAHSLRDYCSRRHTSILRNSLISDFSHHKRKIHFYMPELTSGELGRTVFKPYLKYAQQRGLFNPRNGERLEKAWLRSERERNQAL